MKMAILLFVSKPITYRYLFCPHIPVWMESLAFAEIPLFDASAIRDNLLHFFRFPLQLVNHGYILKQLVTVLKGSLL